MADPVIAGNPYVDEFSVPGNRLDLNNWTTEFGSASFLGRTQLRDWVNDSNIGPFVVTDGTSQLALDTFNPTGFSMYGTHAKTLMAFQPTSTTDYVLTARMRITNARGGIVYGVYFYGCTSGSCGTSHDELDIEFVTNHPQSVQLNRYAAEPLGAGHGPVVNLPVGFDALAFHEWSIRWGLSRVTYSVDGVELFSATNFIPQGPMQANIIAWAPDSGWPDAYDGSLQPASNSGQNQHFVALVDYVSVVPATNAYFITPCRVIDTRNPNGPSGGPSLVPGGTRNVTVAGNCGIPVGATALAVNVTVPQPAAGGFLTVFPGPAGATMPYVSTLNYKSGTTRGNNAIIAVGADGTINIFNGGSVPIDFIIDVNGYFK
jgi:hypothetical protein